MGIQLNIIIDSFIFVLPMMIGNMTPVFTGGIGRIDGGRNFYDGRPLLGRTKTIGGLFGAILAGELTWISLQLWFPSLLGVYPTYTGFLMGIGAMIGDMVGSFIKRRLNLPSGGAFPIMDQIGFLLFGFFMIWPFMSFPIIYLYYTIPITLIVHLGSNIIAYLFKWKDVPW